MGFFRRMLLLLSFFLGLFITFSSGCQAPGNECWSFANGAASGGCCTGTQCGPWSPDGSAWDGSSPWYCLSTPKIAAGGTCNYDAKIGLCADFIATVVSALPPAQHQHQPQPQQQLQQQPGLQLQQLQLQQHQLLLLLLPQQPQQLY